MQLNCAHRHLFEDNNYFDMRVFIALSALLCGCNGLMFHSEAVTKEWDTWVFVENSTYYAYYLVTEVKKMYISLSSFSVLFLSSFSYTLHVLSTPNQVSYGEGFGVATSPDGQHWTDHGYVWHG